LGTHVIKLPDIGEGVAEAELIEWHVNVGDVVREDDVLAVVMTDKANIEVPSSVEGTVRKLGGEVGDTIAVGAELVRLEVAGAGNVTDQPAQVEARAAPAPVPKGKAEGDVDGRSEGAAGTASDEDARRALEARVAREAAPRRETR
jgi:2-oxoisovalerate dehydrogenase E2 component (dihydrolipoyl transacylase)